EQHQLIERQVLVARQAVGGAQQCLAHLVVVGAPGGGPQLCGIEALARHGRAPTADAARAAVVACLLRIMLGLQPLPLPLAGGEEGGTSGRDGCSGSSAAGRRAQNKAAREPGPLRHGREGRTPGREKEEGPAGGWGMGGGGSRGRSEKS